MTTFNRQFVPQTPHVTTNPILSSSPAFATPAHPFKAVPILQRSLNLTDASRPASSTSTVLQCQLDPPEILRPIAFRTFTKKHNLTLASPALKVLAAFIGRCCGKGWREEGLAELALDEVARAWKRQEARVIVDTNGNGLENILKQLEDCMSGGRVIAGRNGNALSRQNSNFGADPDTTVSVLHRQDNYELSQLDVDSEGEDNLENDARRWLKIVNAFGQPRLLYNASKKHFEKSKSTPTFFPPPFHKTELFRQRYHIIYQRVHRNESFQAPSVPGSDRQQWKITPIANLLGRGGSGHLLLGLLTIAPAGTLAISDLTGSIHLDLSQAAPIDAIDTWLCPGMVVLVDGIYEEEFNPAGGSLGNTGGIGGTIGGRFIGFSIGAPKCETRARTLGTSGDTNGLGNLNIGGGFGWVDFLGLGSERAVGTRMRKIEQRLLQSGHSDRFNSSKMVILGSCTLDNPKILSAIRQILSTYANQLEEGRQQPPLAFVMHGSFVSAPAMSVSAASAAMAANSAIPNSIAYKEAFDALALLLSEFPSLLRSSTWIFVPGDADPWPSSFSAGAAVPIPREPIPEVFTNRIRRAFASANGEMRSRKLGLAGEAIWTSNPSRISLFGPTSEFVVFRDDVSGRMRRNHIPLKARGDDGEVNDETEDAMEIEQLPTSQEPGTRRGEHTTPAHSLTKTLLDQSHLSPFPLSIRPQNWDFAGSALSLYPLPTALMLCDTEMEPFVLSYQGCTVLNCGAVTSTDQGLHSSKGGQASWCEYDVSERKGVVMSCWGV